MPTPSSSVQAYPAHSSLIADCSSPRSCFKHNKSCRKAFPHNRDDAFGARDKPPRMLEHDRDLSEPPTPMLDLPRVAPQHAAILAVSNRKRYCLVTGPPCCTSPLCLKRLLYPLSQSGPSITQLDFMRASLDAN
jgi:hypothetical protein